MVAGNFLLASARDCYASGCEPIVAALRNKSARCLSAVCVRVYMKDVQGDTALHDAVSRNDNDIINMLIACTDVDFKLKNQKGFNVLHEATRHGDIKLVVIIIRHTHGC